MTIKCGDQTFRAHKTWLLATGSQYFAAVLRHNFSERETSTIIFDDDEPDIIARVLTWIYTGSYETKLGAYDFYRRSPDSYVGPELSEPDVRWLNEDSTVVALASKVHAKVFAVATRLHLPALQRKSVAFFRDEWAHVYECVLDGNEALISEIVHLAYTTTAACERGIRDIIVEEYLTLSELESQLESLEPDGLKAVLIRTESAFRTDELAGIGLYEDLKSCWLAPPVLENPCPKCGSHGPGHGRSRLRRPCPHPDRPKSHQEPAERKDCDCGDGMKAWDVTCQYCCRYSMERAMGLVPLGHVST